MNKLTKLNITMMTFVNDDFVWLWKPARNPKIVNRMRASAARK